MLSSRLLPGSHLVVTGRSYPIATEPRAQRFADYASEKLAGCQRNAERSSTRDAGGAYAFAGDLPESPYALPTSMGRLSIWLMINQACDMSSRRRSPREIVLAPGMPSCLRPRCPPSLPMSLAASSRVGGESGGMEVLLTTQHNACHSYLSRIIAQEAFGVSLA
jgi:hypothetical protein